MTKLEQIAEAMMSVDDSIDVLSWHRMLEFARIAVENIREPTAEMITASPAISWMTNGEDGTPREISSADSFTAMIDAVLNEKPSV